MSLLRGVRFHTTVAQMRQLPRGNTVEVAFVGRSNAGKSSAINALCGRKRLAFSSNTPGRTQALNYFALGPEEAPSAFLVDMPGYGYAVADRASREAWGKLSGRYLATREQLGSVVLIIDIRRGLGPLDRTLLEWIRPEQRLLVLASKADKLNRQEQHLAAVELKRLLSEIRAVAPTEVIVFSATAGTGIEAARQWIERWLSAGLPSHDHIA